MSIVVYVSVNGRLYGGLTPYAASTRHGPATGAGGAGDLAAAWPRVVDVVARPGRSGCSSTRRSSRWRSRRCGCSGAHGASASRARSPARWTSRSPPGFLGADLRRRGARGVVLLPSLDGRVARARRSSSRCRARRRCAPGRCDALPRVGMASRVAVLTRGCSRRHWAAPIAARAAVPGAWSPAERGRAARTRRRGRGRVAISVARPRRRWRSGRARLEPLEDLGAALAGSSLRATTSSSSSWNAGPLRALLELAGAAGRCRSPAPR